MEREVTFSTDKEALDFLASAVMSEAKRQNISLADEDKRLLYFSAIDPRSALGISEERLQLDDEQFEEKITELLKTAAATAGSERRKFSEALQRLSAGDYYIVIMASLALAPAANGSVTSKDEHRTRDIVLYLLIAGTIVAALVLYVILTVK